MDVIRLLPDSVANQIAAGEVIQRPASVVKELVENAIDAGASSVQIIIKDAGRTLIQVVDNGCGMSVTDARMAFERHATSKIRQATDLYTLHTMGFRGEALPSIAAVSEIDLRTMRRDDTTGTRLQISASKVESQMPEACVPGTNLMVKRLFFNLPARRKFLKKDSVELSHIVREFERLALVNTAVEFTLTHNDVILHKLSPGSLKQRITELFGKNFGHQIIPVEAETSLVRISGFVSLPENARKRNALQYFFVNGRYMRHPYFHKAVLKCYEELIAGDSQPNYFINLTVDPETIDVNIHPQKYEIKFENEQPVWQILAAAVKQALGRFNLNGALDFDAVDVPDIPTFNPDEGASMPDEGVDETFNPFDPQYAPQTRPSALQGGGHGHYGRESAESGWEQLYETFTSGGQTQAESVEHVRGSALNRSSASIAGKSISQEDAQGADTPLIEVEEAPATVVMQLRGRYIVSPSKTGLLLIDQHRAHTLILYEKYIKMVDKGDVPSQRLIFPESVTLDTAQNIVMSGLGPQLADMGFDVSHLGGGNWAINAVPSVLGDANPADALLSIIAGVAAEEDDVRHTQWQKIAMAMAEASAIKYGATLTRAEMDSLVAQLFTLPAPGYTPHGKPVMATIEMEQIHRLF